MIMLNIFFEPKMETQCEKFKYKGKIKMMIIIIKTCPARNFSKNLTCVCLILKAFT